MVSRHNQDFEDLAARKTRKTWIQVSDLVQYYEIAEQKAAKHTAG